MLTGAAFLVLLDAIILAPGPDTVREVIALALTLFVGGFVVWVWVTNTRIEKAREQKEQSTVR
jgi:hypothetical protein